jgi:hypothetical protein
VQFCLHSASARYSASLVEPGLGGEAIIHDIMAGHGFGIGTSSLIPESMFPMYLLHLVAQQWPKSQTFLSQAYVSPLARLFSDVNVVF